MSRIFRIFSVCLSLAFVMITAAPAARAQSATTYPDRPIRLIVPWAPAGLTDNLARVVAQKMSTILGRSVIVDNKPGASGIIGTDTVAKAPADGYTLMIANADTHSINPGLYAKLPYDAAKDFTPISTLGSQAVIFSVNPANPAKSLADLLAEAKGNPNKLSYASWGNGSVSHLATEMLSVPAGVKMVHVPYKGVSPALMDVISGRVDCLFISIASAGDNFKVGKLRPLAISSKARSPLMPDVPTIAESGFPGFDVTLWYGVMGPRGMPPEVVDKLNAAVRAAVESPDVRERFAAMGLEMAASTPAEFAAFLPGQANKWAKAAQTAHIKLD
jgi:tripartite-type tricarboxylate transporter receptor subunit TctC